MRAERCDSKKLINDCIALCLLSPVCQSVCHSHSHSHSQCWQDVFSVGRPGVRSVSVSDYLLSTRTEEESFLSSQSQQSVRDSERQYHL